MTNPVPWPTSPLQPWEMNPCPRCRAWTAVARKSPFAETFWIECTACGLQGAPSGQPTTAAVLFSHEAHGLFCPWSLEAIEARHNQEMSIINAALDLLIKLRQTLGKEKG